MIRIGLPPPMLPRLRLHWHATHTLFQRQSRALREYATRTSAVSRSRWQQILAWGQTHLNLRVRALTRHRTQLTQFEERYEKLVDLLCWAAKEGVQDDREARYFELRRWMRVHYRVLKPRLSPHFAEAPGVEADPFEALFMPECLDEVINATAGIETMMRTRSALDAYHEELAARLGRV